MLFNSHKVDLTALGLDEFEQTKLKLYIRVDIISCN